MVAAITNGVLSSLHVQAYRHERVCSMPDYDSHWQGLGDDPLCVHYCDSTHQHAAVLCPML